jgi:Na+/proline symporter
MYELVPAFFAALLVTVVVSRLTKPPDNTDELFPAMKRRGTSPSD